MRLRCCWDMTAVTGARLARAALRRDSLSLRATAAAALCSWRTTASCTCTIHAAGQLQKFEGCVGLMNPCCSCSHAAAGLLGGLSLTHVTFCSRAGLWLATSM